MLDEISAVNSSSTKKETTLKKSIAKSDREIKRLIIENTSLGNNIKTKERLKGDAADTI